MRRVSDVDKKWGLRLKEARLWAGLSQKQLGIEAGIDEFVASTRINRYELGVHRPDLLTVSILASVLKVTSAYFYADDDAVANLLFKYSKASAANRKRLNQCLAELPVAGMK